MGKKPTRKRPYFTMKYAMTAILRDASGKMHHGILFDRRLDSEASWVIKFGKLSIRKKFGYDVADARLPAHPPTHFM